ncbi:MAG TPA: DUF4416 family protein [Deltaproteobacteria bacterium]|nr:DUF4416 family protein [Deltaproteobacteria bacterium]
MSVITGERRLFAEVFAGLAGRFGPIEMMSPLFSFDHTDYYREEFGEGLLRRFISFERPVPPDELADLKLFTNGVEETYRRDDGRRRVNIDPGYLTLERLVLASCKNFTHRIYLGRGVYADLTLVYRDGEFRALEWTFPDYIDQRAFGFLHGVRRRYARKIGRGL